MALNIYFVLDQGSQNIVLSVGIRPNSGGSAFNIGLITVAVMRLILKVEPFTAQQGGLMTT